MKKRITIKDIADKAGVSIGTVHCALNGKPGVGGETRQRILDIARDCDYRPNAAASSLKRKAVRLAAVLPGATDENRYYFSYVWDGVRDYLASMRDFNIELLEAPYYNDSAAQGRVLASLLRDTGETGNAGIDGLLTLGYMDGECRAQVREFKARGVPVVLVGSDLMKADRFCCVQPDYDIVGRTLSELLSWQAPEGDILVCAGSASTPSHFQIVLGMEAFFRDRGMARNLVRVHDSATLAGLGQGIRNALEGEKGIAACCSVYARGSVALGRALEASGKAGTMPAVGCDIFDENIDFLERGAFTNLIHKNPYSQAYMATKCLADYLLKGIAPARSTLLVGSEIVFQSGIPMFRSGQQALHAFVG